MKTKTLSVILSLFILSQCYSTQFCARLKNVSAGETHTLALDEYGNLWACGSGPLGLGGSEAYQSALSLQQVHGPSMKKLTLKLSGNLKKLHQNAG